VNTTRIAKLEKNGSRMSDPNGENQAGGIIVIVTRGRAGKTLSQTGGGRRKIKTTSQCYYNIVSVLETW